MDWKNGFREALCDWLSRQLPLDPGCAVTEILRIEESAFATSDCECCGPSADIETDFRYMTSDGWTSSKSFYKSLDTIITEMLFDA